MLSRLTVLILLWAVMSPAAGSQNLQKTDFKVGPVAVNQRVDSLFLVKHFGVPVHTERVINTHRAAAPDTMVYFTFDSLYIGIGRTGVRWIDFSSAKLSTHRGVRVGDSVATIKRLYGKPSPEGWLGHASTPGEEVLAYFKDESTLGLAFWIRANRVFKIIVGWGST